MSWITNRNKAAVRGLVSQPITAYVGHLTWQLSVATLVVATGQWHSCGSTNVMLSASIAVW